MSQFLTERTVLSFSERIEQGRTLRAQTPRAAHGDWQAPAGRRDPIDILEESSQGRTPNLVPIRYGRMLADPFAFLRGSAAVMAIDLASTPTSGIRVQACGDCHVANFGLFATPERSLVFDINDFDETLPAHLRKLLDHYRYEDFAFKVVGVGSVGTRCFVALFLAGDDDPLLLQAKEARRSVLEPFAGDSEFSHHGQRIVVGQRLTQSASDMFLGWTTSPADGGHYYIRQLRDMKYSPPLDKLDAKALARYAVICGWVLARAYAKGGDAAMITGYLGKSDAFDKALARFALTYGEQTARDHASLAQAVQSGRLQAILGR